MVHIAFIGAGSVVFTRQLVSDILRFPELAGRTCPCTTSTRNAWSTAGTTARCDARPSSGPRPGRGPPRPPRRPRRGGLRHQHGPGRQARGDAARLTRSRCKHGLRQTIADTSGIGGIFRGLRTIPVMGDMRRDMRERLPGRAAAQLHQPDGIMNAGPSTRLTPSSKVVGLCHSVLGTANELAEDSSTSGRRRTFLRPPASTTSLDRPAAELDGESLYPRLRQAMGDPDLASDKVRVEMYPAHRLLPDRVQRALRRVPALLPAVATTRSSGTRARRRVLRQQRAQPAPATSETRRSLAAGEDFPLERASSTHR